MTKLVISVCVVKVLKFLIEKLKTIKTEQQNVQCRYKLNLTKDIPFLIHNISYKYLLL